MAITLALEKLYADSTATLVSDGTLPASAIVFGWREVPRQELPAARIVWKPGDPSDRAGEPYSAVKPGRTPERPLATLKELWTCYITGYGVVESPPGTISAVTQTGPGMGGIASGDPGVAGAWLVTITTGGDPDAVRFSWTGPGGISGSGGVVGAYLGAGVYFSADLASAGVFTIGTTYAFTTTAAVVKPSELDFDHWKATRILYDSWYRAVYRATFGRFTIISTDWVRPRKEGAWGATIRVVGAIESMIPDSATGAAPADVGADITAELNTLSEDLIAP